MSAVRAPLDRAAQALSDAREATREVHQARDWMLSAASRRQQALLQAHRTGLSVRQIASQLGCSPAVVQHAIQTARTSSSSEFG